MIFNEPLYLQLRARLQTDMLRLSEELIEQPPLMQSAIEAASDCIQIRDACKNTLTYATASATARLSLVTDENGKFPSVDKLKNIVQLDAEVIAATEELEEAKHSAAYWQGLVDSFGEKGSSLRRVAELTTSGYLTPNAAYTERREEMSRARFKPRG
jgi:hypothetical protein